MILESLINLVFLGIGYLIGKQQKLKLPEVPTQSDVEVFFYKNPEEEGKEKHDKFLINILNNAKSFITKRKS